MLMNVDSGGMFLLLNLLLLCAKLLQFMINTYEQNKIMTKVGAIKWIHGITTTTTTTWKCVLRCWVFNKQADWLMSCSWNWIIVRLKGVWKQSKKTWSLVTLLQAIHSFIELVIWWSFDARKLKRFNVANRYLACNFEASELQLNSVWIKLKRSEQDLVTGSLIFFKHQL